MAALRARDARGLFVDALRRVDGLNRADPTAERNAVECICATAAVLGVVLGDDDEWDEKGDVVGEVEVENPREETRGERRSVPGGVSDAVRAERRDARDVRCELAEGLGAPTRWARRSGRFRRSSIVTPRVRAPPPKSWSSETRNPEPDLDLEPSGVLWSFLAVVLGALGPERASNHPGRDAPPASVVDRGRVVPAGVFYAFSAPHVTASPENARRDAAHARISSSRVSSPASRANPPATVHIPRRVSPTVVIGVMPSCASAPGTSWTTSRDVPGRRRGDRRDWDRDGGTATVLSLVVWNECVRLGAPVDPMVEEYLMAHYARAFGPASRGEGFPRGEGFAALVAFGKSGCADAAARVWDRVSRAGARRPGSAKWRANGRFLIAVLRPSSTESGGYDETSETSSRLAVTSETTSRLAVTRNDFRRFEEAFGDDVALVTLAQTLCREGDDLDRVDARVAREALVRCMDARAPPSRAATAVRGETWRECAAAAATLDPRSPSWTTRSPSPPTRRPDAAPTFAERNLKSTRRDHDNTRSGMAPCPRAFD